MAPIPRPNESLDEFLYRELNVTRIDKIHDHLWLACLTLLIKPLHFHKLVHRDILITEDTNLHLVWRRNQLFIKPLPEFLLDYTFFKANLCSRMIPATRSSTLHASACGLLRSYAFLVEHRSDFRIAIENGLLPPHLEWNSWCMFAAELRVGVLDKDVLPRYLYGELSLFRLNRINELLYQVKGIHLDRQGWTAILRSRFRWLLAVFVCTSVVLAAMQTAIAADGGKTRILGSVSYYFSLSTLVLMLGVMTFVVYVAFFNLVRISIESVANKQKVVSRVQSR